jgi:hypothetical protein
MHWKCIQICCLLYITRRVDQVQNRYHDNLIKKVNYSRHDVAEKCSSTRPQHNTSHVIIGSVGVEDIYSSLTFSNNVQQKAILPVFQYWFFPQRLHQSCNYFIITKEQGMHGYIQVSFYSFVTIWTTSFEWLVEDEWTSIFQLRHVENNLLSWWDYHGICFVLEEMSTISKKCPLLQRVFHYLHILQCQST